MCQVLYSSKLYLGLDSGLMHLAVAYGKPTFSIFGASSYELFGYEKFNSLVHKVEINSLNCYPCNGYSRRNKLRVKNPKDCPDNICLINKKPDEVADSFIRFYNELK
jgi:ADP-heptose:LPS heptosyltransferase